MARLEIEIAGVNTELRKVLKESANEVKSFVKGLDFKSNGINSVNDSLKVTKALLKDVYSLSDNLKKGFSGINQGGLTGSITSTKQATEQAKIELANYRTEIARLSAEIKGQSLEQNKAKTIAQSYRAEIARTASETANLKLQTTQNKQQFTAASGSYREAQLRLTALGKSIREAEGGFKSNDPTIKKEIKDYADLNNQLKKFDSQLGNNQRSVGNYSKALSGVAGLAASYFGFTALIAGGVKVIKTNAEISDSLADVRRTAGLTAQEADGLAESLKKIDTRTGLKDLLSISVIAGQLGISKDQIAGFTQAIDQLSVSLSGELQGGAEGVAKSLGILDKVFGVTKSNAGDVNKAYNQIGSAILGLGQSGLATGDFLADFGERVGGVAKQAGLSLPVILSYGAVLQENGVSAEVAGTSFKRLIAALGSNSSKFFQVAKFADANLTLKDFNTLVNTDTKKALDLLFRGLNKGGESTIAFNTILKSLKISGAGVSQTVSAIANNLGDLDTHIKDTNRDFKDATLSADQFAIKNQTLGASIDKLGNAFTNITTNPDSNLGKFFKVIVDSITGGINALDSFIDKLKDLNDQSIIDKVSKGQSTFSNQDQIDAAFKRRRDKNSAKLKDEVTGTGNTTADIMAAGKSEIEIRRLLTGEIYKQSEAVKRLNYNLAYIKDPKNVGAPLDAQIAKTNKLRVALAKQDAVVNRLKSKLPEPTKSNAGVPAGFAKAPKKGKSIKSVSDFSSEISDIVGKSNNSEKLSGLEDLDKKNEQTKQKYGAFLSDLDKKQKSYTSVYKGNNDAIAKLDAQSGEARKTINDNFAKEISQNGIKFAQDKADIIAGIEDKAGVTHVAGQEQELQRNKAYYDALVLQYKGNSDILKALSEARTKEEADINQKYFDKRVESENKIFDKIGELSDKGFNDAKGNSKRDLARVDEQLNDQLAKIKKYYDDLAELNKNNPIALIGIAAQRAGSVTSTKEAAAAAKDAGRKQAAVDIFASATQDFGKNFIETLNTINDQADRSFGSIISTLGENLNSQLNDIFSNQLGEILKNLVSGVGVSVTDAIGGLSIAVGSLVSGLFAKTSAGGQALGGALKGAGSGAILGTAIGGPVGTVPGAIIGGLVGAIGGLFGSSKAKKEEKARQDALAEQKKQTALLERANALAYSASIIGRQTVNGVVTGVEVNEFGQLTTSISGQNLQIVLDRANVSRKRGI